MCICTVQVSESETDEPLSSKRESLFIFRGLQVLVRAEMPEPPDTIVIAILSLVYITRIYLPSILLLWGAAHPIYNPWHNFMQHATAVTVSLTITA